MSRTRLDPALHARVRDVLAATFKKQDEAAEAITAQLGKKYPQGSLSKILSRSQSTIE